MRSLVLNINDNLVVPTFADHKRHRVQVEVQKREDLKSVFGEVKTVRVRPRLTFSGLYKKTGDPTIWFTDDQHKVPVMIKAKITLGSLVGKLVDYQRADDEQIIAERK